MTNVIILFFCKYFTIFFIFFLLNENMKPIFSNTHEIRHKCHGKILAGRKPPVFPQLPWAFKKDWNDTIPASLMLSVQFSVCFLFLFCLQNAINIFLFNLILFIDFDLHISRNLDCITV